MLLAVPGAAGGFESLGAVVFEDVDAPAVEYLHRRQLACQGASVIPLCISATYRLGTARVKPSTGRPSTDMGRYPTGTGTGVADLSAGRYIDALASNSAACSASSSRAKRSQVSRARRFSAP